LGSNTDDPKHQIEAATSALKNAAELRNIRVSSWRWTKPFGPVPQPDYLNGVVAAETQHTPEDILKLLQRIEDSLGRDRRKEVRWGPRPIDLDLLMLGSEIRNTKELTLPHSGMTERRFVLEPFAELAPNTVHPITAQTVRQILGGLS
jgi:2-amino-4-hydroxy-6-hydroxymethyldihydropteridine diphosphokinase